MNIKKRYIAIIIICLSCTLGANAQLDSLKHKNEFKVSSGFMNNRIFRITEMEESGHLEDGLAQAFGFTYSYPMDEKLWMGIGLSYLKTTNIYNSPVLKTEPAFETKPESTEQIAEVIYLPAFIRYDFNQWFGLRFGMSIEIAIARSDLYNQNGLGFFGGPFIHYQPHEKLDLGIEPMVHVTAMLPIPQEFYQQHFLLTGANAYLALKF